MNTTLTHPPAEDLGRFVEGTMDEAGRAEIVAHLADCDDCRIVVVDATELADASKVSPVQGGRRWWMASAAASLMLVVAASTFVWNASRNPLSPVQESKSPYSRTADTRLDGFLYAAHRTNRGGAEDRWDPADLRLSNEVTKLLSLKGNDPKTLHARGVGHLLNASLEKMEPQASEDEIKRYSARIAEERSAAVRDLQAATTAGDDVRYLNDLAVALITKGDPPSLVNAVKACDRALKIDPRSTEVLFNKAIALRALNDPAAASAFQRYLDVDKTSLWADEARLQLELLK